MSHSKLVIHVFQLTTSRRGRLFSLYEHCTTYDFNSLPHAEVDRIGVNVAVSDIISTHYLTQR